MDYFEKPAWEPREQYNKTEAPAKALCERARPMPQAI